MVRRALLLIWLARVCATVIGGAVLLIIPTQAIAPGTTLTVALGLAFIAVPLLAGFLALIFSSPPLWQKIASFVVAGIGIFCLFATYYAAAGVSPSFEIRTKHGVTLSSTPPRAGQTQIGPPRYACFGSKITKVDAIYFTLGAMTAEGTGTVNPRSQTCRAAAAVQMVVDLALIGFGVAALTTALVTPIERAVEKEAEEVEELREEVEETNA